MIEVNKTSSTDETKDRVCRDCGCTDDNCQQCIEAQGHPCHWVEENLCSRCATEPENENSPSQESSGPEDPPEEKRLADLTDEDLKGMKKTPFQELCRTEELSPSGNKEELLDRLMLKKYGLSNQYVNTMTKCKVCSAAVHVTGTKKTPLKDGRILWTRQIKCRGRHHHTYPLKDILQQE